MLRQKGKIRLMLEANIFLTTEHSCIIGLFREFIVPNYDFHVISFFMQLIALKVEKVT